MLTRIVFCLALIRVRGDVPRQIEIRSEVARPGKGFRLFRALALQWTHWQGLLALAGAFGLECSISYIELQQHHYKNAGIGFNVSFNL